MGKNGIISYMSAGTAVTASQVAQAELPATVTPAELPAAVAPVVEQLTPHQQDAIIALMAVPLFEVNQVALTVGDCVSLVALGFAAVRACLDLAKSKKGRRHG